MRLLLDTHAFLWTLSASSRLSLKASEAIGDTEHEKLFSAASAMEITTKYRLGKLPVVDPIVANLSEALSAFEYTPLAITVEHAARAGSLPFAHRDPFDRLLIAQAQLDDLVLVSNEKLFDGFGVRRLW